jgi:hypothetical protein
MKEALERTIETLDTLLWVATLVVAIGVVGEAAFGIRHILLSKRLRRLQHTEDQKHEEALERLHKDAEGLRLQIAQANERAANNEREATVLQKLAEDERLARVKIEEKLAYRHLNDEQREHVWAKLEAFAGQKVNLFALGSDPERLAIGSDIASALHRGGWIIYGFAETMANRPLLSGIVVEVNDDASESAREAAKSLVLALRAEQLIVIGPQPPERVYHATLGAPDLTVPITITIGSKP